MGAEVDRLEIQVEAQAGQASQQLDLLIGKLTRAASATGANVGNMRNYAKEIGRMAAAVRSFSGVKIPNFSTLTSQLQQLSKINLDNLKGKKINIDLEVNGNDKANQLKNAIEKTIEGVKVDSGALSKKLAESFSLGRGATNQLKSQIEDLATSLASSFDGKNFHMSEGADAALEGMAQTILENGSVVRSAFEGTFDGIREECEEFYEYFKSHKIYVSDFLKEGVGKGEFNEYLRKQGALGNVTRDPTKGINLNSEWEELSSRFPSLIPKDTINDAEQLITVLDRIKEIRESIMKPVSIGELTGDAKKTAEGEVWESVLGSTKGLSASLGESIQKSLKETEGQLLLDVKVNEDKIVRDIKNAIDRASHAQYDAVKVKLDIDSKNIENAVTAKLQGLDVGNMPQVADGMKQIADSMIALNGVSFDGKGVNNTINALRRLVATDLSSFDPSIFAQITQCITGLASAPDVSNSINRFVSSLARLASAGQSTQQAADALPALSQNLKNAIETVSSAADVSAPINAFVQSISSLANAGNKTGQTAAQLDILAQAVMRFLQTMANAPQMSQSTVAMTQALAQLASAGGRVDTAAGGVQSAFNRMSSAGSKFLAMLKKLIAGVAQFAAKIGSGLVSALGKAGSTLASVFGKVASGAMKASKSVISAFTGIGKSSKHINTATFSLRNLLRSILPLMGIRQIFSWGKNAIDTAASLTEVQNVVDATFGPFTDKMDDFAKVSISQFGMSQLTAKQVASRFQSMGVAMGIAQGEMADMSISLTKLTADMASFYDVSQDKVAESLEAIFTGQTRPLTLAA